MESKVKNIILIVIMLVFFIGMGGWFLIKEPDEYSYSERRVLMQKPEFSKETYLDGKFGKKYEDYALEQFPMRDSFRSVKAINENFVFLKGDSNGIVFKGNHLSKIEYPIRKDMLKYAADKFEFIYKKYLKSKKIKSYFVMIPDKNYYLEKDYSILSMDYEELYKIMLNKLSYMKNIDIRKYLSLEDYYYTDTHWKQEKITDIASVIGKNMGVDVKAKYKEVVCDRPFNGVYVGQAALPVKSDRLVYLKNNTLDKCIVKIYDSGNPVEKQVYNLEKLTSKDMYEVFLSGAVAVLTIENPNASTDKELVMFRDSFGSSIAPLLIEGYSKITMIDIRYIRSDMIGAFVDFSNQDVLFMYSVLVLNNSLSMK